MSVPWWVRVGAKLVLARLPVPYSLWRRLSIFRHGQMDRGDYALGVFEEHLARSGCKGRRDFVALEMGPGDSLLSALAARAYGASRTILVDAGDFATRELEPYRELARLLASRGLPLPSIDGATTLEEVLQACGATYEPRGLAALASLPPGSVDLLWSQAVLEHVRRGEFDETLRQMRRILAPGGVASHRVDLRDHLGGGLANLRFSERVWEAPGFAARSGFYTNRLRYSDLLRRFEAAGFRVEVTRVERWPALPTPRRRLDPAFRSLPDEELLVCGFDVLLR